MYQFTFIGGIFVLLNFASCQQWNDASAGITVKTLYVPLQKGSSSIPIPDFSQVRPLATLNIPNFATGGDLQLASTLNHNFHQKLNVQDQNVLPLQDVRAKFNQQIFKAQMQGQIPKVQVIYPNSNFQQQQYKNQVPQQTLNQHAQTHNSYYQPQPNYVNIRPQNVVFQRNNTVSQHQNNGFSNGNIIMQDPRFSIAGGRIVYLQNTHGHQVHTPNTIITPRHPNPSSSYTQYQDTTGPMQNSNTESYTNQESSSPQNSDGNYSGESSRQYQQIPSDSSSHQQTYTSTPTENQSFTPNHQQTNYGIQKSYNSQFTDSSVASTNPFQGFHQQENRQIIQQQSNHHAQQPVNTYAIVHQRVPTNNFGTQSNRDEQQFDQSHSGQYNQNPEAKPPTSHSQYMNNEPTDYTNSAPNQVQAPYQTATQNQLKIDNSQNTQENNQYQVKQATPITINNQQFNAHQLSAYMQQMISQFQQNQQGSSAGQYFNNQQTSSGNTDINNQDLQNNQQQNTASQSMHPDPSSETYYSDNQQQVYVAPPTDYNQQNHQSQQTREQDYVRYSTATRSGSQSEQNLATMQNGQTGMTLPNQNFGY